MLRSDDRPDDSELGEDNGSDGRIPWEALLKLHDTHPVLGEDETGGLACLIMRVRELHEIASAWQHEISSFTQLSLRGGKRRGSPSKGSRDDAETEQSERVEVEKLTELCRHPVLEKVSRDKHFYMSVCLESR